MKYFLYPVLICVMGVSCRFSGKKEILGIDSMKVVMWDMMKADELYMRMLAKDSTAGQHKVNIRLYEEVLALHKTTKGQFDSSYKFYEAHPVAFKALIDSLEAFSAREKNRLSQESKPH
jgi:hypothetical protein